MRGLLLRGKIKAAGEFLLACIAHNLRKIAKKLTGRKKDAILCLAEI
jgi:hypothetical protein